MQENTRHDLHTLLGGFFVMLLPIVPRVLSVRMDSDSFDLLKRVWVRSGFKVGPLKVSGSMCCNHTTGREKGGYTIYGRSSKIAHTYPVRFFEC
jgi:hypothetical protein